MHVSRGHSRRVFIASSSQGQGYHQRSRWHRRQRPDSGSSEGSDYDNVDRRKVGKMLLKALSLGSDYYDNVNRRKVGKRLLKAVS